MQFSLSCFILGWVVLLVMLAWDRTTWMFDSVVYLMKVSQTRSMKNDSCRCLDTTVALIDSMSIPISYAYNMAKCSKKIQGNHNFMSFWQSLRSFPNSIDFGKVTEYVYLKRVFYSIVHTMWAFESSLFIHVFRHQSISPRNIHPIYVYL